MNFIKKAQKQAKDIQNAVKEIDKATAALGINKKEVKDGASKHATRGMNALGWAKTDKSGADKEVAPAGTTADGKEVSATSTPASTTVNTPITPASTVPYSPTPTSAAPSSSFEPAPEKPKIKLSLAQRKNVRDGWENRKADVEKRLTAALGTPWICQADAAVLLNPHPEGKPADVGTPGDMIYEYFDSFTRKIEDWVKEKGEPFIQDLNTVANNHVLALDLDDKKQADIESTDTYVNWQYNRPAFNGGVLYLLINREAIWSSAGSAGSGLDRALNVARASAPGLAGQLDADTKASIGRYWEPEAPKLLSKAREILANNKLEFDPNFQEVWAPLDNMARNDKDQKTLELWSWREQFGAAVLEYFSAFVSHLEENKFHGDDMLQEAFNEAIDKNVVRLVMKETLSDIVKGSERNEAAIDNGVLCLCTKPEYWRSNTGRMGFNVMDLL